MEAEFLDFLTLTVKIAPWTGSDGTGYSVPSYGPDVVYQCRISLKDEYVRSHDGRETVARGRVYLNTSTIPTVRDRITLPAGYVPVNPPILDVMPEQDERGVHHVALVIG